MVDEQIDGLTKQCLTYFDAQMQFVKWIQWAILAHMKPQIYTYSYTKSDYIQ